MLVARTKCVITRSLFNIRKVRKCYIIVVVEKYCSHVKGMQSSHSEGNCDIHSKCNNEQQ